MFQVAELVATLRLDKGNYDSGLASSSAQMEGFKAGANSLGATLGGALAGGMRAAAVTATALGVTAAALLKTTLSTGIAYNTLQQTSRAALNTLMGGAQAANAQMDKLDAFAKTSPFSKSVFITAQQQLIGFGMAGEKVIPTLQAVNDAVAAIGGSNQDISDITMVLAQIQAAGKITGEDLMQMAGHGINAAELIGKAMGKTGPEIKEAITKGTIGGQEALDALVTQMGIKFEGAAANVKNTMTGASDRVKSATRDIGAALAEPFVSKNGGGRLVQWTNDWADALRALEKRAPSVVNLFMNRLSPAVTGVSVKIGDLKNAIKGFDISILDRVFSGIAKNLPAVAAVTGAVLGLTSGALAGVPVIGGLLAKLSPLGLAISLVAAASPEMRTAIGELFKAVSPLLPAIGELATALSQVLSAAIVAAVPLLSGAAEILHTIATFLAPLISGLADVAGGFGGLPGPVQTVIVALAGLLLLRPAITTMFSAVGTAASNMGTKLAGASVGGALKGLLGIFGGPWGLAIGAAVVGLSLFAAENQKTKQRIDDFSASLDQNTGAITHNTSVVAGQKLLEYADTFKALRLNAKDAADAVANGGPAFVKLQNRVNDLMLAVRDYNLTQGSGAEVHAQARFRLVEMAKVYGISAEAATNLNSGAMTQLLQTMSTMRGEVDQTSEEWKTLNAATEKLQPTTLTLSDAIDKVGDSSANTTDRMSAYRDIIDAMNGKTKSVEQTQRDLGKSTRDLVGFFSEVDDAGNRVNASLSLAADGTVQFNDSGDKLSGMLDTLGERGRNAALAAADLANAQNRGTSAAADADKALQPFRDTLQDLANKGLISQTQVDALSKSLFGIPGETSVVITDKDSAAAVKLKMDELKRAVEATPDKTILIKEPLSDEVKAQLIKLGYVITDLPDKSVKISQNGAELTAEQADKVRDSLNNIPKYNNPVITPSGAQYTAEQADKVRDSLANIPKYTSPEVSIHVYGMDQIEAARAALGNLAANSMITANAYATGAAYRAEGGIVEFYANGGVRHPKLTPMAPLAAIVPQNTWRVVGDNMKVPELYAPLDGSARSLALLREGVQRSGFDMVRRGEHFAGGGVTAGAAVQVVAGAAAPTPNVSVMVLIDGKQMDARMEVVADNRISKADRETAYRRTGRST